MTPDDVDPRERVAQLKATRADLEHRLHILAEGERSGFRGYLWAFLEPMLEVSKKRILVEKDVHEMVRLQARIHLLEQIVSWPEREMAGIKSALGSGSEET